MRETTPHNPDTVEITKQVQVKKGLTAYGRMYPQKGHKIWEYNPTTGKLDLAKFTAPPPESKSFVVKANHKTHKDIESIAEYVDVKATVIMDEDCYYFSALNKKNAIKILKREYEIDYDENNRNPVASIPE